MSQYFAGIDIGSTMTKVAIVNGGRLVKSVISRSSPEHRKLANLVMQEALSQAGLKFDDIEFVVATGYGRMNVPFADRQVTEITCHARGISASMPSVKTANDIGGQDSKAMRIENGKVTDFVMNDKCAAGSGRFIEVMAGALGVKLEDIGTLSLSSQNQVTISNTCVVFAEQEVMSRLAEGIAIPDLARAIHDSLATRIYSMAARIKIKPEVAVTGGGAKNEGLVHALEEKIGYGLVIPEEPLMTGAMGAALIAEEIVRKAKEEGREIERKHGVLREINFYAE